MGKLPIFITLLVLISLFVSTDYYLNFKGTEVLPSSSANQTEAGSNELKTTLSAQTIMPGQTNWGYVNQKQIETPLLFEKINLSSVENTMQYRNELAREGSSEISLVIYEILGKVGQGSLTYLDVKLQMVAQLNVAAESINENSQFGHNSLF
ncbi:hypothetical protein IPJ72_03130 [Candidatus Peregrinibacteria bacterium]|nr:MAG: hypothetical protein IPJ72_03130 [Candidatus Peregrinibacteria bacterium]